MCTYLRRVICAPNNDMTILAASLLITESAYLARQLWEHSCRRSFPLGCYGLIVGQSEGQQTNNIPQQYNASLFHRPADQVQCDVWPETPRILWFLPTIISSLPYMAHVREAVTMMGNHNRKFLWYEDKKRDHSAAFRDVGRIRGI